MTPEVSTPEALTPDVLTPQTAPPLPDPDLPAVLQVPARRAGLRAVDFLALELPFLSRTRVRQKIQTGESLLNGRRYATSARVQEGDRISVLWRGKPARTLPRALTVLYEDEHLVAFDKPAGVASHPVGRIQTGTVIQLARMRHADEIHADLCRGGSEFYPCLVHRLDAQTSGVILVAKRRTALRALQALAAAGGMEKRYVAVVEGILEAASGRIDLPIGRDETSAIRLRMSARPDGKPAVTDYRVSRRLSRHTVVCAFPRTGRQHQVRVHLAAIGHPVCGDLLYEDEARFLQVLEGVVAPARHLLHAESLTFMHPVTRRTVEVVSPIPSDFAEAMASLEAGAVIPAASPSLRASAARG